MKNYTVKIISNKAVLTSDVNEFSKKTFNDINLMVDYVNKNEITITNPDALPINFRNQLTIK